jgi:hypothetical protein
MIDLNDDELTLASSGIFVGKVVKLESFWNEKKNFIYTRVRFDITENLKNNGITPPDEIIIPGGKVGEWELKVKDMPRFISEEETMIFVNTQKDGKLFLVGNKQGKKSLTRKDKYSLDEHSQKTLENIRMKIKSQGSK